MSFLSIFLSSTQQLIYALNNIRCIDQYTQKIINSFFFFFFFNDIRSSISASPVAPKPISQSSSCSEDTRKRLSHMYNLAVLRASSMQDAMWCFSFCLLSCSSCFRSFVLFFGFPDFRFVDTCSSDSVVPLLCCSSRLSPV